MHSPPVAGARLDHSALTAWYLRNRERSRAIFDLLAGEDTYYSQPIDLRHPIVFYEGHLPAFSFNTLVKQTLGRPALDPGLEELFARGIDPSEASGKPDAALNREVWPDRARVRQFADEADRAVLEGLARADADDGQAAFTILEHEAMHQETLLYMWHRLPFDRKHRPASYAPRVGGTAPAREWREVPAGRAVLGVDPSTVPFGWDNEFPAHAEDVAAFSIEQHDVTNEAYMEYVEATGAQPPLFWERHDGGWFWRGMFDLVPLPAAWPVYVSHAEAAAYARWRGHRLPTEAEFQRAAYGTPDGRPRTHPWGGEPPTPERGVFDFSSWDPEPAGSHPAGRSAWGIDDLVGNGWKWTSTVFAPFEGFAPMKTYPQYSADFFDGEHYVIKGASPATASELLRPSFRNWFRPHYPYVYATFRLVRNAS
jgi:iron(II)-dependent oxidoreductase